MSLKSAQHHLKLMADSAIKAAIQARMKEAQEKPNLERPPNLREGGSRVNCASCAHYAAGMCDLYQYRVEPEQVCDSWAPLPEK